MYSLTFSISSAYKIETSVGYEIFKKVLHLSKSLQDWFCCCFESISYYVA